MKLAADYQNSLIASIILHVGLLILLLIDPTTNSTTFTTEKATTEITQNISAPQVEPIKAVSVNENELNKTITALKQKEIAKKQAEINHQRALEKQIADAKRERLAEQKRVQQLKQEAERIAIAKKKQIEQEQKRLKEIALQKKLEEKHLEEMKKKQALEAAKLDALAKKKVEAEKAKMAEDQKRKEQENAAKLAAKKAADAAESAQIAGEVDRYKALIIGAISRQWILPESADKGTSSQFRIRLAPDGSVLEVTLTRGSGDALLDRSAESAIFKASPLPVPTDQKAFNVFRDITLTVRPENARG